VGQFDVGLYAATCRGKLAATGANWPTTGHRDAPQRFEADVPGAILESSYCVELGEGKDFHSGIPERWSKS